LNNIVFNNKIPLKLPLFKKLKIKPQIEQTLRKLIAETKSPFFLGELKK